MALLLGHHGVLADRTARPFIPPTMEACFALWAEVSRRAPAGRHLDRGSLSDPLQETLDAKHVAQAGGRRRVEVPQEKLAATGGTSTLEEESAQGIGEGVPRRGMAQGSPTDLDGAHDLREGKGMVGVLGGLSGRRQRTRSEHARAVLPDFIIRGWRWIRRR